MPGPVESLQMAGEEMQKQEDSGSWEVMRRDEDALRESSSRSIQSGDQGGEAERRAEPKKTEREIRCNHCWKRPVVGEKIRSGPRSPEFRVRKMDLTTGYQVLGSVRGSVSCVKPHRKQQGHCRCAECIVPSCVHRQLESPKKGRNGCSTPGPHSLSTLAWFQSFRAIILHI